ncbi:hypothetical protein C8Q70DRAFT_198450 [Cubamyces menziesii]|nr:hypothetical protein C8Q70DRAFT_198450 [Cubamyces menziesii]
MMRLLSSVLRLLRQVCSLGKRLAQQRTCILSSTREARAACSTRLTSDYLPPKTLSRSMHSLLLPRLNHDVCDRT